MTGKGRGRGLGIGPVQILGLTLLLAACGDAGRMASRDGNPAAALPLDTLLPVADTRLFIHGEGEGEPLVVVHGGPLLDHTYLLESLRPLARDHRLVFFDQRLSGRSDGDVDPDSVRLDRFVEDIEGLRETLGLGRIHLLGHSWGGLLALRYALEHPERLRSLILVSPMAPSASLRSEEEAAMAARMVPGDTAGMGALRASLAGPSMDPDTVEELLRLSFRSQLFDPSRAEELEFVIPGDYGARSRQFSALGGELSGYDLAAGLESLHVPALVIYGEAEPGADIGGEALRRGIPNARLHRIPEAGHFAFLEQPVTFRGLVRMFLSADPPAADVP